MVGNIFGSSGCRDSSADLQIDDASLLVACVFPNQGSIKILIIFTFIILELGETCGSE